MLLSPSPSTSPSTRQADMTVMTTSRSVISEDVVEAEGAAEVVAVVEAEVDTRRVNEDQEEARRRVVSTSEESNQAIWSFTTAQPLETES